MHVKFYLVGIFGLHLAYTSQAEGRRKGGGAYITIHTVGHHGYCQ
jgi:hypothetical protein